MTARNVGDADSLADKLTGQHKKTPFNRKLDLQNSGAILSVQFISHVSESDEYD